MIQNLKNGGMIVIGEYAALKEGTGKTEGRKATVKLNAPVWNADKKKMENKEEWLDFWNGKEGQPQLYTRIKEVPRGTTIVCIVNAPNQAGNKGVIDFLNDVGSITAFKGNDEVNVFVGTPIKASVQEVNGKSAYTATFKVDNEWVQVQYFDTAEKKDRSAKAAEKVSKTERPVFIAGKRSPFGEKKNAFTCVGGVIDGLNEMKSEPRLPESDSSVPESAPNETDPVITIGIHAKDQPRLSTLTAAEDIGWMRAVLKYYKPQNDAEQKQFDCIAEFVNQH